ncbi:MAG: hypothetical protein ABSB75_00430 [Candidatus Limnocylindrales bacterium]|jgi:hypothetical protein
MATLVEPVGIDPGDAAPDQPSALATDQPGIHAAITPTYSDRRIAPPATTLVSALRLADATSVPLELAPAISLP